MRLIQVLGPGCENCDQLAENAQAAVAELRIEAKVERVEQIERIIEMGALMTPALAVDGEIRMVGKVLTVAEIKALLADGDGRQAGEAQAETNEAAGRKGGKA